MIQTFDDRVPFVDRNHIYNMAINSDFKITGWPDRYDLELTNKHDLHSKWPAERLNESRLLPYLEKCIKDSVYSDFKLSNMIGCTLNATKPGDFYYTHTHEKGSLGILYYVNLTWENQWAGETIFYKDNMKDVEFTSAFVPDRFLLCGDEPHSIRSQSFNGPAWRFTLAFFFKK